MGRAAYAQKRNVVHERRYALLVETADRAPLASQIMAELRKLC